MQCMAERSFPIYTHSHTQFTHVPHRFFFVSWRVPCLVSLSELLISFHRVRVLQLSYVQCVGNVSMQEYMMMMMSLCLYVSCQRCAVEGWHGDRVM